MATFPLQSGAAVAAREEPNSRPQARSFKLWTTALKAAATVVVLVLLFTHVDLRRALALWAHIRLHWAAYAILFLAPNLFCQYRRWRVGLVRAHPTVRAHEAFRALLIGLAMGAVTPGRVGELGQVMFLPSGGRRRALGVMAVMRLYAFVATVSFGLLMWAFMPGLLGVHSRTGRAIACACLVGISLLVAMGEYLFRTTDHPRMKGLIERLPGLPPVFLGVQALKASDRVRFVAWSLSLSVVYLTQLVWLMRAFGGEVAWMPGIAAGAVTIGIVALLPVALGNIGVRESAAILVWHHLGVAPAVALNAAFVLFLLNVIIPGLCGLLWNFVYMRTHRAGRIP